MHVGMEDIIANFLCKQSTKTLLYFTEQLLTINFFEKILKVSPFKIV